MKLLDVIGTVVGVTAVALLLSLVVYVNGLHTQQINRLSTAIELPNGDAPVPVGYPVVEVV